MNKLKMMMVGALAVAGAWCLHADSVGWYYAENMSVVGSSLIILGDVHIILKNSACLMVNAGQNTDKAFYQLRATAKP